MVAFSDGAMATPAPFFDYDRLKISPQNGLALKCRGTDQTFSIELKSIEEPFRADSNLATTTTRAMTQPNERLLAVRITEIIDGPPESMTLELKSRLVAHRLDVLAGPTLNRAREDQQDTHDHLHAERNSSEISRDQSVSDAAGRDQRPEINKKILLSLDLASGVGAAWPQTRNVQVQCVEVDHDMVTQSLFGAPSLYEKNPQSLPILRQKLQPLDILLTRNSELTSRLLPGYFSHAAVVIGSAHQLKELGLWNHPTILPLRDHFKSEPLIIEAIIPKVRIVSLSDFLKKNEEILVLRKKGIASQADFIGTSLGIGIQQLNKPYDLLLDIESEERIFCAELPKMMYDHVRWPTRYGFGINSIMPDNFAGIVFHLGSPFDFISHMTGNPKRDSAAVNVQDVASRINFKYLNENAAPIRPDLRHQGYYWSYEKQFLGIEFVEKFPAEKVIERRSLFFKHIYRLYHYQQIPQGPPGYLPQQTLGMPLK